MSWKAHPKSIYSIPTWIGFIIAIIIAFGILTTLFPEQYNDIEQRDVNLWAGVFLLVLLIVQLSINIPFIIILYKKKKNKNVQLNS